MGEEIKTQVLFSYIADGNESWYKSFGQELGKI